MEATNRVQEEEISGLVLTYRVNDTLLCIPVEDVESIIEPPTITELPHAPDYVLGAFMHRGQTALALSLHKLLGLPASTTNERKESLLVIWMGDQPVGYWVDEVKGMTDSNRGHWSAVPALIRDQGITRALVCDGQVYFPIDLTHSKQFNEITRALKEYEQSKLQHVWDKKDDVSQPPLVEQDAQPQLDTPEESVFDQPGATDDAGVIPLEEQPDINALETEPQTDITESEPIVDVVDYQVDDLLTAENDEQNEASFLADQGIDTAALAKAMHAAMSGNADVIPLHPSVELQFDVNGQADAFYDLIAEAEAQFGPVALVEVIDDEIPAGDNDDATVQLDAFDDDYQTLLAQDILDAEVEDLDASEQDYIAARESLDDVALTDDLDLTEEPYSFLPTSLPADDDAEALLDKTIIDDDVTTDEKLEPDQQAELRQLEIDSAIIEDTDIADELHEDEDTSDNLALTEEPYSFLPTSLPVDDEAEALLDETIIDDDVTPDENLEPDQQAELRQLEINSAIIDDADIANELHEDKMASDALALTEEPYSFLPTSLPTDDEAGEETLLDELVNDDVADITDEQHEGDVTSADLELTEEPYSFLPTSLPADDDTVEMSIDAEASVVPQSQPLMLLPDLSEQTTIDNAEPQNHSELPRHPDSTLSENPVIALPHEQNKTKSLPEFSGVVLKADFYANKMVTLLKDTGVELKPAETVDEKPPLENKSPPLTDEPEAPQNAELYELKIPQNSPDDEPPEPAPSLGEKHITPLLEQGAIIIRPDGQINKNFGLVKLFTIILATSAAGSWWYRDELFYREQLRKEIPSILSNEIAYLYSDRVTIISPNKGAERMIVETPEQEIKVVRRRHVSRALLRESRKKDVIIHRVRRGDTLWAIASRYLDDPYRYPELAENNRIHDSDFIHPGDVVKITNKKHDSDK